jgi:hypothetical protein
MIFPITYLSQLSQTNLDSRREDIAPIFNWMSVKEFGAIFDPVHYAMRKTISVAFSVLVKTQA